MVAVVADNSNDVISHLMPLPDHVPVMEELFTNKVGEHYGWFMDPDDDRYYRLDLVKIYDGSFNNAIAYIVDDEQLGYIKNRKVVVGRFNDGTVIPKEIKNLIQRMRNFDEINYNSYDKNGTVVDDEIRGDL
jgi:hypothetical protein